VDGVRRMNVARGLVGGAVFAVCLQAAAVVDFGDAWQWALAPRRFGGMAQAERVVYSRAEDLFRTGNYESAAIEFEKFMAQYPRSPVRSHALLLQAYSLHLGKQRNQAIGVYTEIMDFFREVPEDAAPAMYLKGNAQIQNGNVDTGFRTLKDLVEDDALVQQPIADLALNQLALHALGQEDTKAAERYWLRVVDLFSDAFFRPEKAVIEARKRLVELFIVQKRGSALDDLLARRMPGAGEMTDNILYAYDRGRAAFPRLDESTRVNFFRWFKSKKSAFDDAAMLDDFYDRALALAVGAGEKGAWGDVAADFSAHCTAMDIADRSADCARLVGRIAEAAKAGWRVDERWQAASRLVLAASALDADGQLQTYNATLDRMAHKMESGSVALEFWDVLVARTADLYAALLNPDKDRGLSRLVDRLKGIEQYERGFAMAGRIEDPALAQWKRVEIYGSRKQYAEMAAACEDLENADSGTYAARAMNTRADLYKDRLGRHEDAIKLYSMINDPPRTIWCIADCYEALKRPASAVNALSELESFFERDAPQAAYRKALVWERAGDEKKAIAACRSVLKKYPKHGVSSQAHQMLERYGIKTGGGVMEVE